MIFYIVSGIYGPAKFLKNYLVTILTFTLLYLPVFWSLLLWLFQYDHFPLVNKLKYVINISLQIMHELPDFVKAHYIVHATSFYSVLQSFDQ